MMMNDSYIRKNIQHAMNTRLSGLTGNPFLAQHILANDRFGIKAKKRFIVVMVVLLLVATITGLAWSLSMDYFSDVAKITLESGDYECWSFNEKRYMIGVMEKYGLVDRNTSDILSHATEDEIDKFISLCSD